MSDRKLKRDKRKSLVATESNFNENSFNELKFLESLIITAAMDGLIDHSTSMHQIVKDKRIINSNNTHKL